MHAYINMREIQFESNDRFQACAQVNSFVFTFASQIVPLSMGHLRVGIFTERYSTIDLIAATTAS